MNVTGSEKPAADRPHRPVRSAYAWAAGGTFAAQGVLWLISLVVMRILQPSDYGLIGIINVFFSFCRTIQDAGLSTAIVQRPELNQKLLSSVFWFFLGVGSLLMLAALGAAPIVARMDAEPRIPALMRTLAVTFVLIGVRTVPMALLTRALNFRSRSTAEVLSAIAASMATLVSAVSGLGVWSLVIGGIANEATLAVFTWRYAGWRPSLEFDWPALKSLMRFGLPVTGSTLIWQFYIQSDFLMIGLLLGAKQLGWYTLAWQLAMVPVDRLTTVMNKANLPVFASLQNQPESLRSHWRTIVGYIAWCTFPMAAGLALVGGDVIQVLLPAKWAGAVPVLPQLALLGAIRSIAVVLPNLLMAMGKPMQNLFYNCINAIVYPIAFAIAARHGGISAVGWAWVILNPLLTIWLVRLALPVTPLTLSDYFAPLARPATAALVMAACVWIAGRWLTLGRLEKLEAQILTGLVVYGALAALWLWQTGRIPWRRAPQES